MPPFPRRGTIWSHWLISLIDGVCNGCLQNVCVWAFAIDIYNGRLQNAPTQHTLKVIDYHSNQVECCAHWLIFKFINAPVPPKGDNLESLVN